MAIIFLEEVKYMTLILHKIEMRKRTYAIAKGLHYVWCDILLTVLKVGCDKLKKQEVNSKVTNKKLKRI